MKAIARKFHRLQSIFLLVLLAICLAILTGAQPTGAERGRAAQPQTATGTAFTYQGQLKSGGNLASGQYDFIFTLYDALSGGNQVGTPVNLTNQTVAQGLFTVSLDFGTNAFGGDARWLEIAVRQTGGGTYTTLSPRQPLTAVPYAISLATGSSGAAISSTIQGPTLVVTNTNGNGTALLLSAPNNLGLKITAQDGIFAQSYGSGEAIYGLLTNGNGAGVSGESSSGDGVRGYSTSGRGVVGATNSGDAVYGQSISGDGVYGASNSGWGIHGEANVAVYGHDNSSNGIGVFGDAFYYNGIGVKGSSGTNNGVYGESEGDFGYAGVYGFDNGTSGAGVYGTANGGPNAVGVRGQSSAGYAGYFDGNVHVQGAFSASTKNFKIDDPLDPANKYLYHTSVESPDMMDIYNGNVTTDAKGEAVVVLPDYFEALNEDFRYQLTIMGDEFAQARVSSKIASNRFIIKTDKPNIEVSWQVTGIRHDPYAENNRTQVVQDKGPEDKGKYLYPQGYGQPESMQIMPWPDPTSVPVQAPKP